jgi:hypothetical protein
LIDYVVTQTRLSTLPRALVMSRPLVRLWLMSPSTGHVISALGQHRPWGPIRVAPLGVEQCTRVSIASRVMLPEALSPSRQVALNPALRLLLHPRLKVEGSEYGSFFFF